MTSALFRLAAVAVCAFGIFTRFANLDRPVYWHDEAITSLWLSGHTRADVARDIFSGREFGIADLDKYQRLNADRGIAVTVAAATEGDPQVSPLHLVLLRLWAGVFGDSVVAVRSFSALCGVLALAAIYWLSLELFQSTLAASIAVALLSISPFQIAYSREARTYAFWSLTVLLATAALLRARRTGAASAWVGYAFAAGLAMHAHALSAPVLVAHGVYVVSAEHLISRRQLTPAFKRYLAATVVAVILFVPWAVVLYLQQAQVDVMLNWVTQDFGFGTRASLWARGLLRNHFDFEWSGFNALLGLFLLAVIGAAVVDAWRRRATPVFLLPVLLMASTFVFLAVPDLVAGGRRSVVPRYLVPTYLGVVLTIAAMLAATIVSPRSLPRRLARFSLAVLVGGGLASSILGWNSAYHWTKGELGRDALRAAAVANNSPRTLLVTDATHGIVLSLSHLLNPAVRLQASDTPESIDVAEGFSTIVLFRTPPALRERLRTRMHVDFELVDEPANLWRSVQRAE